MYKQRFFITVLAFSCALPVFAQDENQPPQPVNQAPNIPVYRVNVVQRTTQAIDYRNRNNEVKFDMSPTSLLADARGSVKVRPRRDRVEIETSFNHMKPATMFGPEYLTYVLWAITPEGRPVNLGEVQVHLKNDTNSELRTTTPLQVFGLIVTAEPYAAVTRPSDLVVLENRIGRDVKADTHPIETHFEALNRREYRVDLNPAELPSQTADRKQDKALELLEAENAIAIAKAAGAQQYAATSLQRSQEYLNQSQNAFRRGESSAATAANSAQQTAEDARLISIRAKRQEELAKRRAEQQQQLAQAQSEAQARQAEAAQAQQQAQRYEQQRLAAETARQEAMQAAKEAAEQRQQAEVARQQALAQAQQSEQARQAAEQQVAQTRERLRQQLNSVLQTRESARGLIVNMSDVLFDVNKSTLKPDAQVRLARVAGILMAYPDLKVQVEGFTDSTGTEEHNQTLSDQRASTVRSFLVTQGVPSENISSQGFGESQPIASNDTASGRQQNRRVNLVVSGSAIGQQQVPNNGITPSQTPEQPGSVAAPSQPPQ